MVLKIDNALLDSLTEQAKASQRLRMNHDLRNIGETQSQRKQPVSHVIET